MDRKSKQQIESAVSEAMSKFLKEQMGEQAESVLEVILPAKISTQVIPPEPLADFIHVITSSFGVLANFADDMRHLQRSEIAEIGETLEASQVGSSTMPQKSNPIGDMVTQDPNLKPYLEKLNNLQKEIIFAPAKYIGISPQKVEKIISLWKDKLKEIAEHVTEKNRRVKMEQDNAESK